MNQTGNKDRLVKINRHIALPFFLLVFLFFFEILWEQISLQTAEAPKWSRSNLSAPFFPFRAPPQNPPNKRVLVC